MAFPSYINAEYRLKARDRWGKSKAMVPLAHFRGSTADTLSVHALSRQAPTGAYKVLKDSLGGTVLSGVVKDPAPVRAKRCVGSGDALPCAAGREELLLVMSVTLLLLMLRYYC